MSKELEIYTGEVLTEEEQKALNLELDHIINAHKNNRQEINKLVFECVTAMSEADDASDELSSKGFFSGLWGSVTGSNRRLQNRINANRAAAQYASQQCLQKLAEQNLMTFDLITAVNNKLNASLIKVGAEFNKTYEVLVKFFKQNKSELVRLETRLEKVEKNVNLLNWQNSIEYQEFDGTEYVDLDPITKIVCLTKDFYKITKGKWSTSDLLLLKTAMSTIDLNPKDIINYYDAVKTIAEDDKLKYKLFESTNLIPIKEPQYLISASGIQKISAVNNEEKPIISSIEEYIGENGLKIEDEELKKEVVQNYMAEKADVNLDIEIECYDFVLDLLYNLQGYEDESASFGEQYQKKASKVLVPDGKLKENFDLIKEQAENGNATAMYLLSLCFDVLYDNKEKYKAWLNKAVEAGEVLAKIRCYTEYEYEKEIDKDIFDEILNMAEYGNVYAIHELGDYYYKNKVHKNYEKAFEWYSKAAEQGYASAQCDLAYMYYNGHGVDQNYEKAFEWYSKAAEQGDAYGQDCLGVLYRDGKGVEQSYVEAIKWFRKAVEQGFASAQNHLGDMYYYGKVVERDYKEAFKWYRKAVDQGNDISQFNLGNLYLTGKGVERNFTEAIKCYIKAADQGQVDGQVILGVIYQSGKNYIEAIKWFKKAADQGDIIAQNKFRELYQERESARQNYEKAVNLSKDVEGLSRNYEKILKWFRKAAEQGFADAQNSLGNMYYNGIGDKNYAEAFKWFKKAAEQGLADAQNSLGNMYYYGDGVEQDYAEALKWYKIAAEQGLAKAQFNIGRMYETGKGVTKDYQESRKWFQKAAMRGHPGAMRKL